MSNKLDMIQIPKPCPADWEEMTGNDRMRYCEECKKHVYNLSKMSRREAEALIATRGGNLCARIIRNPDGTVLTQEIISSSHPAIRRASPVASAVVTAILTISSSAVAQSPALTGKPIPTIMKEAGEKKPDIVPQTGGGTASVTGTITDANGAVITAATVRLTCRLTGGQRIMSTNQDGVYNFVQVDAGSYTLMVEAPNFTNQGVIIAVQQGEESRLDITMRYPIAFTGGAIALPVFPLRKLYEASERIVVARVSKSSRVEAEGDSVLIKTQLRVSSTLKGSGREGTVDVYHWVYGEDDTYTSGANLLVFLKRRQDEKGAVKGGYEVIDTQRGVKKLSEADLQVYLQRIDELTTIMSKEKHDQAEIVEWLVRCAVDPATRWEGVYELAESADSLPAEESEESEEPAEANEAVVEDEETPVEEPKSEAVEEVVEIVTDVEQASEPPLAALLTTAQKERLTQTLLNIQRITEEDRDLIDLVRHWNDGRLVPYLLGQLKQMEANPSRFAEDIVTLIADSLEDEDISQFAEEYSNNISYDDLDAEEEAATAEEAEETDEAEPVEEAEEAENVEEAEEAEAVKVTPDEARQNRSEMLKKFIALVESKVKNEPRSPAGSEKSF